MTDTPDTAKALVSEELRAGNAATEPVRDRGHALDLLDDVVELIRFCSVNMLDTERYYRGSGRPQTQKMARSRSPGLRDDSERMSGFRAGAQR